MSILPSPSPTYLVTSTQSSQIMRLSLLSFCLLLNACGGSDDEASSNSPNTPDIPSNPAPPIAPNPEVDTNWLPAGGTATIASNTARPFLHVIPTLPTSSLGNISAGRELFITQWTPAGVGRVLFDGVGPLFNANACTQCHSSEARKPVYADGGALSDAMLFRLGNRQGAAHSFYGEQMQHQSIDPMVMTEGKMRYDIVPATKSTLNGVSFSFTPTDPNQPLGNTAISGRLSPQLVGMGMLNLITDADIIAAADADDSNNDGISGRVHWVSVDREQQVGRFGWKAISSSLRTQNANAMSQDMGLTTSVFKEPNCTVSQFVCKTLPNGGIEDGPEVIDASLDAVTEFMTALAVPERRVDNIPTFNHGAALFTQARISGWPGRFYLCLAALNL